MRFRAEELRQHEDARNATHLVGMLPALSAEVDAMKKAVQNRVLTAINSGTFTERDAYQAWLEVHAATRLLQRMEQQVNKGLSGTPQQKENY